jgi:hypothetical protein
MAHFIEISGNGEVTAYWGQEDSVDVQANARLQNVAGLDVTIERAAWALTGPGGWLLSGLMSLIPAPDGSTGDVFGVGPDVPAGTDRSWGITWGRGPYTHMLFALTTEAAGETDDLVATLPISRTTAAPWKEWPSGIPAPGPASQPISPLALDGPVIVVLQGPVDQIDDETGGSWVHATGQVVNATGESIQLVGVVVDVLCSDGSSAVGPKPLFSMDGSMTDLIAGPATAETVLPFHLGIDLPVGASAADLLITVLWSDSSGTTREVTSTAPVEHPIVKQLHLPISPAGAGFVWNFGNGVVHRQAFTGHTWSISQRYAYDLGIWREDCSSWCSCQVSGGSTDNTDYYCYGTPVLALDDGVVVMVREDGMDNNGNTAIDPLPPPNIVTLRHDDGRYSVYAHIKPGSATDAGIAIGDRVAAGHQIAEIGNNGGSSEPHLHVAYWEYTDEGWERTLPMRFANLVDTSGDSVTTTPREGFQGSVATTSAESWPPSWQPPTPHQVFGPGPWQGLVSSLVNIGRAIVEFFTRPLRTR